MEDFEVGDTKFDIAQWIMSSLHFNKVGVLFDLIAIRGVWTQDEHSQSWTLGRAPETLAL